MGREYLVVERVIGCNIDLVIRLCVAWAVAPSVALALPPLGVIMSVLILMYIEASFIDPSTLDACIFF